MNNTQSISNVNKLKIHKVIMEWFDSRGLHPEDNEWKMIDEEDIEELESALNHPSVQGEKNGN